MTPDTSYLFASFGVHLFTCRLSQNMHNQIGHPRRIVRDLKTIFILILAGAAGAGNGPQGVIEGIHSGKFLL